MHRAAWELHPVLMVAPSLLAVAALVLMALYNVDDVLLEPRRFLVGVTSGVLLSLLVTTYQRWAYMHFEEFYIGFFRTPILQRMNWDLQKKNFLIGFPAFGVFLSVLILSLAFRKQLSPLAMGLGALVPFASLWSVHQQLKVKVERSLSAEPGGDPGAA